MSGLFRRFFRTEKEEIPPASEEKLSHEEIATDAQEESFSGSEKQSGHDAVSEDGYDPEKNAQDEVSLSERSPSWFRRLHSALSSSSRSLSSGIGAVFSHRRLDDSMVEELEDVLLRADLGVEVAERIMLKIGAARHHKDITSEDARLILAQEMGSILNKVAHPIIPDIRCRPYVILIVGVNGSGKTTTIGKLAHHARREGLKVMIAACDTFRAAAIEQLAVWSQRSGSVFVSGEEGRDPSSVAWDALSRARNENMDLLLIDTAGRLQNRRELMAELEKLHRVLGKQGGDISDSSLRAPHSVLLIIDSTVGQNALSQVQSFMECVSVSGLIVTKLDGGGRGGILVALADRFGLPVHAIAIGEKIDDLDVFNAHDYARALVGLGKEDGI